MRVPIELLSGLANCLLNDTVFEIVKGLMEIQHVTEKHLFQQRLQIINRQTCKLINFSLKTTSEHYCSPSLLPPFHNYFGWLEHVSFIFSLLYSSISCRSHHNFQIF